MGMNLDSGELLAVKQVLLNALFAVPCLVFFFNELAFTCFWSMA